MCAMCPWPRGAWHWGADAGGSAGLATGLGGCANKCVCWGGSHARELKWAGESKHQKCTSRRHSRDGETERSLLARDGDPVGGPHGAGLSGIRVDA